MDAALERILTDDYLGDLRSRSMQELRALRAECLQVETQLSYLRRIAQGRHDIVRSECDRRRHGGDPAALSELVDRLPQILADESSTPRNTRNLQGLEPGAPSVRLGSRLERIVTASSLLAIGDTDDDALEAMATDLQELERELSQLRRAVFGPLDALQAELTRRYRDGEAHVEELLHE